VRIGSELATGSLEPLAMPHFERLFDSLAKLFKTAS